MEITLDTMDHDLKVFRLIVPLYHQLISLDLAQHHSSSGIYILYFYMINMHSHKKIL